MAQNRGGISSVISAGLALTLLGGCSSAGDSAVLGTSTTSNTASSSTVVSAPSTSGQPSRGGYSENGPVDWAKYPGLREAIDASIQSKDCDKLSAVVSLLRARDENETPGTGLDGVIPYVEEQSAGLGCQSSSSPAASGSEGAAVDWSKYPGMESRIRAATGDCTELQSLLDEARQIELEEAKRTGLSLGGAMNYIRSVAEEQGCDGAKFW